MKIKLIPLCICFFAISPLVLHAVETTQDADILAKRGKGVLYQSTFEARVDKIPQAYRKGFLDDRKQLQDTINALLVNAQLAAEAREAGFDKEKIVTERMELAAETELAEAWLQHYAELQPEADFEQMALEYYQLHEQGMMTPATIDVSHILISTKDRSAEEAKVLADSLSSQLAEKPSLFDEFVMKYSEDPKVSSNKGKFKSVKKGDMLKPFEEVAFSLKENEISLPVKTTYGFHIIRLDAFHAPTKLPFDEVKPQLIERERKQHEERIKRDYLGSLTSLNVQLTEEALQEMARRQLDGSTTESPDRKPETE